MILTVVRGGALRPVGEKLRRRSHRPAEVPPNAIDAATLDDDPGARRRELLVVMALCEARERGARLQLSSDYAVGTTG